MRVQCETNASVKDRTNDELRSILRCLVLPDQCYHSLIENHFKNPRQSDPKDGCGDQCSYCDGSYRNFGARVSKSQLIAVLTTHVFSKGLVPAMSLISRISSKENKQIKQAIWKGKGGHVNAGHVHTLVLMLIASKILELSVPQKSTEANNNKIPLKTIEIGLAKQYLYVGDVCQTLSIYVDTNWEVYHMSVIPLTNHGQKEMNDLQFLCQHISLGSSRRLVRSNPKENGMDRPMVHWTNIIFETYWRSMIATRIYCPHLNERYLTPADMNNIRRRCGSQIINKRKVHATILADVTGYLLLRQNIPNILVSIRISVV